MAASSGLGAGWVPAMRSSTHRAGWDSTRTAMSGSPMRRTIVSRSDPNGNLIGVFGTTGIGPDSYRTPTTLDAAGNFYEVEQGKAAFEVHAHRGLREGVGCVEPDWSRGLGNYPLRRQLQRRQWADLRHRRQPPVAPSAPPGRAQASSVSPGIWRWTAAVASTFTLDYLRREEAAVPAFVRGSRPPTGARHARAIRETCSPTSASSSAYTDD